MDKAVVTCALTGVLTNPKQHPVPVTAEEMARSAREAFDAGASVMHVHFRDPREGKGHLPTWDPSVAADVTQAIRDACPGVIINMSTGTIGPDIGGALACLDRIRPEMAACNAGSLNYLKVKSDGTWAWPPMLFDNPVDKVERFLKAMAKSDSIPEFECFDVGIVRCVGLYCDAGLATHPEYNFVMGVESGMPADPDLLPILLKLMKPGCNWQVTAIGRENIWPLQQRVAELGGMLRTGLEDTFYLPGGAKARGNGELIEALVRTARGVGRDIASPAEARQLIGVKN
jgi:3-keto-5-aminohexanoate cleavage enzyme